MVFCVKLQRQMEGLTEVPFDGHPLGQRIYDNVSKQAWGMWVEHMKMLMNEYRLNLGTKEAQEFLIQQMEQYFFGEGSLRHLNSSLHSSIDTRHKQETGPDHRRGSRWTDGGL